MHARKFAKFKFIVRDARVFPGIWFNFIYPHNSSLFFATPQIYIAAGAWLQPIRIRFTALSCFETNIYQRVFLRGRTHANKAVTYRQNKICKQTFYYFSLSSPYINPEIPTNSA